MLTGQQKAQILISLLDESSVDVLSHLSDKSSKIMTSIIDETPDITDEEMYQLLEETFSKINDIENELAYAPSGLDDSSLDSLNEFDVDNQSFNTDIDFQDDTADLEQNDTIPSPISINNTETETKAKPSYNPAYRHPKKIASILQHQHSQLSAFFLTHCDDSLREQIEAYLPKDDMLTIKSNKVMHIPSSKRVFESMFNEIVLKQDDDEIEDDENERNVQDTAKSSDSLDQDDDNTSFNNDIYSF